MRLPFVSRAAHDEIVALYRQRAESAEAARDAADARHTAAYQDLLTRYQSLVERSAKAGGVPEKLETVAPEVDFVLQAAHEKWGNDAGAMQFVSRYISDQRAKAKRGDMDALNETELLQAVIYGVSASEGVEF